MGRLERLSSRALGVLERRLRRSASPPPVAGGAPDAMTVEGQRSLAAGFGAGILTDLVVVYGGG